MKRFIPILMLAVGLAGCSSSAVRRVSASLSGTAQVALDSATAANASTPKLLPDADYKAIVAIAHSDVQPVLLQLKDDANATAVETGLQGSIDRTLVYFRALLKSPKIYAFAEKALEKVSVK